MNLHLIFRIIIMNWRKMMKNKKKQQSFFDQQVQKLGENWLCLTNTDTIRKNALKVLKDLAFGNIDPYEDAKYFGSADFTYNIKVACDDNSMYNYWTYVGLNQYLQMYGPQDPNIEKIMCQHYDMHVAYTQASAALNNILTTINTMGDQYVPAAIMQANTMLSPYKYSFSGYFVTIQRHDDRRVRVPRREIGEGRIISNGQEFGNQSQDAFWKESD